MVVLMVWFALVSFALGVTYFYINLDHWLQITKFIVSQKLDNGVVRNTFQNDDFD